MAIFAQKTIFFRRRKLKDRSINPGGRKANERRDKDLYRKPLQICRCFTPRHRNIRQSPHGENGITEWRAVLSCGER